MKRLKKKPMKKFDRDIAAKSQMRLRAFKLALHDWHNIAVSVLLSDDSLCGHRLKRSNQGDRIWESPSLLLCGFNSHREGVLLYKNRGIDCSINRITND